VLSVSSLTKVDGGGGTDTIGVTGDLTAQGIDGADLAAIFTDIEQLDFTNADLTGPDTFDLDLSDLQSITGKADGSGSLTINVSLAAISLSDINVAGDTDTTVGNTRTVTWASGETLVINGS